MFNYSDFGLGAQIVGLTVTGLSFLARDAAESSAFRPKSKHQAKQAKASQL